MISEEISESATYRSPYPAKLEVSALGELT